MFWYLCFSSFSFVFHLVSSQSHPRSSPTPQWFVGVLSDGPTLVFGVYFMKVSV